MASQDLMSINTVAARLGLSVHQLRRWELMFGLDIKRGRGQQRQYRPEDLSVLERIKELVEQGWPTSQIRPQIEAEGLISPKLIGVPTTPGNPEVVLESIIGFRNFAERRFIEISKQIDELRQLVISLSLKQELAGETDSPWQPVPAATREPEMVVEEPRPKEPPREIEIGPEVNLATVDPAPAAPAQETREEEVILPEVTDQNYLTVLGRALDLIGWSDEEADEYSDRSFGIPHWDELGRSQAEKLIEHLSGLIRAGGGGGEAQLAPVAETVVETVVGTVDMVEDEEFDEEYEEEYIEDYPGEAAVAETSFEPPPFPEADITSEESDRATTSDADETGDT